MKTKGFVSARSKTSAEGPLLFGLCSQNLTVAQIQETLILDGPTGSRKNVDVAVAARPVFPIRCFGRNFTNDDGSQDDGYIRETPVKWSFGAPGWQWWVANMDSGAPLTSGMIIDIFMTILGVWLD